MFANRVGTQTNIDYSYFQREFQIAYQPIFSLVDQSLVGFESLLRWQQNRKTLYPSDFIPMLKSVGLCFTTDCWVLREACYQMRHWLEQALVRDNMTISVNILAAHLEQPQLITYIESLLAETGLPGQRLCLELAQNEIIGAEPVRLEHLKSLKNLGVSICIDDFSPTIESLTFLQDYPIDTVKINPKNVLDAIGVTLKTARLTLKQIQYFGTRVIFQKLENEVQVNWLKALGCQCYAQGFLFSKPLSQRDVTCLLSRLLSQIDASSVTLQEMISGLNNLSYVASQYLGFSIIKRYWQSVHLGQDWLSVMDMTQNIEVLFVSDIDLILDLQQQQQFQQWVLGFIQQCSLIIRDFPDLLKQGDLTGEELILLAIAPSDRDSHGIKPDIPNAA